MLKQFPIKTVLLFLCLNLLIPCSAFASINISTCADLKTINNNLSETYVLVNDIDCTGYPVIPIANSNPFTGTLDGAGHKISNISMPTGSEELTGLFEYTQNATIKNLILENMQLSEKWALTIGCLVGSAEQTTIDNVSCSGSIYNVATTTSIYPTTIPGAIGGLVGMMSKNSTLTNSSSSVNVTLDGVTGASTITRSVPVGGLVGALYDTSSIMDSHTSGGTTGISNVGGLVGAIYPGSEQIVHSYATGVVGGGNTTGSSSYAGGLVGSIEYSNAQTPPISIENSYATNVGPASYGVNGHDYVGGLIGGILDYNALPDVACSKPDLLPQVINSFANNTVIGGGEVGGLIGKAEALNLVNNYSAGAVTAYTSTSPYAAGGLIDEITQNCTYVTSSYWDQDTAGLKFTDGNYPNLGRTTAQMYQQATYINWDFNSIWNINEDKSYPCLVGMNCANTAQKNLKVQN